MPNKLTSYILDNGLTVYFYNDDSKHAIHAELVTKYGGRYKDFILDGKEYHISDGVAHLIEHFLCEHGKAGNFLTLSGDNFIESNAFTSLDATRYYIYGTENMEKALDIMLTNIYNPIFTVENFEKVKKAIYEEIRRANDRKFFEFNVKFNEALFHNSNLKSNIGTIKEIEDLDLDTVKACYKAFYQPSNQFLIIAGNFDKDSYLKQIKDFFANQKTSKHEVKLINKSEPLTVKEKEFTVYKKTTDTYTNIRYKISIKDLSPKEKLDLEDCLGNYLDINFGYSSDVRTKLEKDKIIVGGIYYYLDFQPEFVIAYVEAYTTDSNTFIKTIQKAIDDKKFNKELYDLNIKQSLTRFILRYDSISRTINPFIGNLITFNYPYLDEPKDFDIPFEKYKEIISNLDFNNYTIGYLIDPKDKEVSTK